MPSLPAHDLNERAMALIGVDIFELIEQVRVSSIEYGTLKAQASHMEHYRKSKLAIIIEEIKRGYMERSEKAPAMNALENEARASRPYVSFLQELYRKSQEANVKGAEHFALRNRLEAVQEMLKTARAELYMIQNS